MKLLSVAALAVAIAFAPAAQAKPKKVETPPAPALSAFDQATVLRDDALKGNAAWQWTADLTTRFGARPAGSDKEKAAAEWAAAELKKMGFDTTVVETFPYHPWVRGKNDSIEITGAFAQKLNGVALGGTTGGEVEAEAVMFDSYQAFLDSKTDVTGKIVVILQPMAKSSTGGGYGGMSGPIRAGGPGVAQQRGAVGFVMRALSTDDHRFPHAGASRWSDGKGIPAMAISSPDAAQLSRIKAMQAKGEPAPVRLKMVSGASFPAEGSSVNVVAEIKGSEHPEQVVIIGGHLDSWDLGTGAIDDGVGTAIAIATAKSVLDHGLRPKRTIRVVLWGSEEMSQPEGFDTGGGNYAKAHAAEAPNMVMAIEADFGADKVVSASLAETADPAYLGQMAQLLTPLGIYIEKDPAQEGDSDTDVLYNLGVPCLTLRQDGYRYFDIHHTPDDVLERIDPPQLNQIVAAWSATLWMIADSDIAFKRPDPKPAG